MGSIVYGWILANRDELDARSNRGLKRNGGLKVVNRDGSKVQLLSMVMVVCYGEQC